MEDVNSNMTTAYGDGLNLNSPVLQVRSSEFYISSRLETMIGYIVDPVTKESFRIRFLLDTGSSHSFIKTQGVEKYNLSIIERRLIGLQPFGCPVDTCLRDIVSLTFTAKSHSEGAETVEKIKLISVPQICDHVNSYKLSDEQLAAVKSKHITLSDPEAAKEGVLMVDILIGQDYYHQFVDGPKLHLLGGLVLIPSIGGYVMGGSSHCLFDPGKPLGHSSVSICVVNRISSFVGMTLDRDQQTIDQFASLECIGIKPEEDETDPILEEFTKTITHDGRRYMVDLPKIPALMEQLKTNFPQVFRRLVSGLKKLDKPSQEPLRQTYLKIMEEQIDLGILEEVACLGTVAEVEEQLRNNPKYYNTIAASEGTAVHYLPHFPVRKASDGSYRLVYDAAAKPFKGELSLNDCLETGPDLISSLASILIRFRLRRYACKGDISKAFLQIEVNPNDRDCLRLL